MTLNVGHPPPHPIIKQTIKMNPSVFEMFRCLLKVEVYLVNDYEFKSSNYLYKHHQVLYTQSQNISHYFGNISCLTLPQIYDTFKSFKKQKKKSFKMIPNTTYIVLSLRKYNRSKSSFLTVCAGYIFISTSNFLHTMSKAMNSKSRVHV